jgi:hypothetical protein
LIDTASSVRYNLFFLGLLISFPASYLTQRSASGLEPTIGSHDDGLALTSPPHPLYDGAGVSKDILNKDYIIRSDDSVADTCATESLPGTVSREDGKE